MTLVWGADAVKKQWLQVTVLPTPATGLAQPDVFYFGNALGETGNSVADARVTGADALRVLGNVSTSAAISNRFDMTATAGWTADRLLILGNLAALDPLILLSPTGGAAIHARPPPVGHEFRITDVRRVPFGMRIGWRSVGSRVAVWTAESPLDEEWTMDRVVDSGEAPGNAMEVILPHSSSKGQLGLSVSGADRRLGAAQGRGLGGTEAAVAGRRVAPSGFRGDSRRNA